MSFQTKKIVSLVFLLTCPLLTLALLPGVFPSSPLAHAESVGLPGTKQISTVPSTRLPVPVLPGDINMNGRLEIGDIELLQQFLAGKSRLVAPQDCYDVNADGSIDVADLVTLTDLVNAVADGSQIVVIEDILIGDVTGDGVLDERDLILLSEYIFGVAKIPTSDNVADFDRNGVVDLDDLLALVDFYYGGSKPVANSTKDPGHRPMPKLPSPGSTKKPGKRTRLK